MASTSQASTHNFLDWSDITAADVLPSATPVTSDSSKFTVVSHRKGRKLGIPLVIRPTGPSDLRKLNPRQLHNEIVSVAGETPSRLKFTSTGAVAIDVRSEAAASRLLAAKSFVDTPTETQIPAAYLANSALIRGIPANYSDEELEGFLRDQGVIRARRRHRQHPTLPDTSIPTEDVILHFEPNTERPEKLDLGFWVRVPRERISAPPRCYRCQKFGHVSRHCASAVARCSLCSGDHGWKDCPVPTNLLCANCNGARSAADRSCPSRLAAIRRSTLFVTGQGRGERSAQPSKRGPSPSAVITQNPIPGTGDCSVWSGDHSYAQIVKGARRSQEQRRTCNNTSATTVDQLAIKQRRELEDLSLQHERERRDFVLAAELSRPQSAQSQPQSENSLVRTIIQAMSIVMKSLNSLVGDLPLGHARSTICNLTSMMMPLEAIAGELQHSQSG